MNGEQLTRYLDGLTRVLRSHGAFDASVVAELRDHLIDAIEDGIRRGLPADVAERQRRRMRLAATTSP